MGWGVWGGFIAMIRPMIKDTQYCIFSNYYEVD